MKHGGRRDWLYTPAGQGELGQGVNRASAMGSGVFQRGERERERERWRERWRSWRAVKPEMVNNRTK